jgi:hypothetical protein
VLTETAPAAALNPALCAPSGTVSEASTVNAALLLNTATANPPLSAALVSETVQDATSPEAIVPGSHVNPASPIGATTANENVLDVPLCVAVSTAVPLAARLPTVAAKLAFAAPAPTVTDAGTVTLA